MGGTDSVENPLGTFGLGGLGAYEYAGASEDAGEESGDQEQAEERRQTAEWPQVDQGRQGGPAIMSSNVGRSYEKTIADFSIMDKSDHWTDGRWDFFFGERRTQ